MISITVSARSDEAVSGTVSDAPWSRAGSRLGHRPIPRVAIIAAIAADDAANAEAARPRRTRTGKATRASTAMTGANQAGTSPNRSQSPGASARDQVVTTTHRTVSYTHLR